MPRPKLNPTEEDRRLVKSLAAVGIPQEDIALKIGIRSPKTLRKFFRNELDLAAVEANANVGGALYKNAMDGDTDAQKFWLGCRGGWKNCQYSPGSVVAPPFIVALENTKKE